MCWVAWSIEQGPYWQHCSEDALLCAPLPFAYYKRRRIDPEFKAQLTLALAKGELGSTAGAVMRAIGRLRGWKSCPMARATLEKEQMRRQHAYLLECRKVFSTDKCRIVSVSTDGTRVGKRDVVFGTLYSVDVDKAMWLPPQVTGHPRLC